MRLDFLRAYDSAASKIFRLSLSNFALSLAFISASILLSFSTAIAVTKPLDLERLVSQAELNSERVRGRAEEVRQFRFQRRQAQGSLLPSVQFNYAWLKQDVADGGPFAQFRLREQQNSSLSLTQPIFRGFAEYAGLNLVDLNLERAEFLLKQEKLNIVLESSDQFYELLKAEAQVNNLKQLLNTLNQRVRELRQRTKVGRSDSSEWISAQSRAILAETNLIEAEALRASLRENLLGLVPDLEFDELKDSLSLPSQIEPVDDWIARALERPDLRAAELDRSRAQEEVRIARAGFMPEVNLRGNYYLQRPGVFEDVDWDVTVNLVMPLFQGGLVYNQTKIAASQKTQAELNFAEQRRRLQQIVKAQYQTFVLGQQRLRLLKETIGLSKQNYEKQLRDYRRGLISFLEVIQVETDYWEIQQALDRVKFDTKRDWVRLKVAVGERP